MLKINNLIIALFLFLVSCSPNQQVTPTAPFKEINYTLLGTEYEGRFVVISPEYKNDREALQFVINKLCKFAEYCAIHFWDNEKYAVKSVMDMTVESKNARVAFYTKDKALGENLEIYK
ncbi:MAG: hypothetical protein Q8L41_14705 [Anaerolineales bacterium]|nr:hypothetical protein [Anaerolineales bacterium]